MQTAIIVTVSNTRAQVVGAGGLGFRLEPLHNAQTGNPVRMSVSVRLDRNPALVFSLTDDAPRHFGEPFGVLEIVGGTVGDQWLVTVFDSVGDRVGAPARALGPAAILILKEECTKAEQLPGLKRFLSGREGQTTVYGQGNVLDCSGYDALWFAARGADANGSDANGGQGYTLTCEVTFFLDSNGRVPMEVLTSPALQVLDYATWRLSVRAGSTPAGDTTWVAVPRRYPYVSCAYWFGPGSDAGSSEFAGFMCLAGLPRS